LTDLEGEMAATVTGTVVAAMCATARAGALLRGASRHQAAAWVLEAQAGALALEAALAPEPEVPSDLAGVRRARPWLRGQARAVSSRAAAI